MSVLVRLIRRPFEILEHKVSQVKENIKEEIADKVRQIIILAALALLMLFIVLFLSIALAAYLNFVLESPVYGYLIVAGIYILMFIILFLVRRKNYLYRKTKQYADYFMRGMY